MHVYFMTYAVEQPVGNNTAKSWCLFPENKFVLCKKLLSTNEIILVQRETYSLQESVLLPRTLLEDDNCLKQE